MTLNQRQSDPSIPLRAGYAHRRQILFLISILLVAATLIAYEPIRHNGFVNYDDDSYVTGNPNVNRGITCGSVIWAFTKSHSANWHPLTWLSHMLDCEIYGLNPLGHHITSVILHVANSLLLFLLLSKMTGVIWPGAFVAAVFALHPLHVESVAWASERKDVLSGLFWMLTMLAYIRYAERPNIKRYSFVLLAFAMGLMSKPMVVTLPFVLLLLDYWPLGRKLSIPNLLLEKIPLFVLSALSCVITLIAQQRGGAIMPLGDMQLDYRIANMFISYIRYIGKTLWPSRLAVLYPNSPTLTTAPVAICALLFILLSALSIYTGRRKKYAAMGWLWFVGTLVPVIGLVQVGSQAMADRYMYIPIVGLLIIIAWAVQDLIANQPRWKVVAATITTVILSILLILTRTQVGHWQNTMTLFEHTLKATKNNAVVENTYGCDLAEAGRVDEAVMHLKNAVRIWPSYSDARNNLGKVFLKQGKPGEAAECFNEALQASTDPAEVYVNLAAAYSQLGRYEPAIQNLAKAAALKPDRADILNSLAWILAAVGDASAENSSRAIEYAQHACELTGHREPSFLDTLAAAYAAAGRFDDAVTTAQQAVNVAKTTSQENLVSEIQNRLKLYRAGQPYRQKRMTDDR